MAVQTKDKAVTLEVLKSAYDNLKTLIDTLSTSVTTALNGKVPTTRTINGKALSTNITLQYSDLEGAMEMDTTLTQSGAAADAKATGDAIANVQSEVTALDSTAFSWGMLKNGFGWNG